LGSEHLVNHAEQAGRFTNPTEKISSAAAASFAMEEKIYIIRKSLS